MIKPSITNKDELNVNLSIGEIDSISDCLMPCLLRNWLNWYRKFRTSNANPTVGYHLHAARNILPKFHSDRSTGRRWSGLEKIRTAGRISGINDVRPLPIRSSGSFSVLAVLSPFCCGSSPSYISFLLFPLAFFFYFPFIPLFCFSFPNLINSWSSHP